MLKALKKCVFGEFGADGRNLVRQRESMARDGAALATGHNNFYYGGRRLRRFFRFGQKSSKRTFQNPPRIFEKVADHEPQTKQFVQNRKTQLLRVSEILEVPEKRVKANKLIFSAARSL